MKMDNLSQRNNSITDSEYCANLEVQAINRSVSRLQRRSNTGVFTPLDMIQSLLSLRKSSELTTPIDSNEVFTSTPLEEQFKNFKIPDRVKFTATRDVETPILERKKNFRRYNTPRPSAYYYSSNNGTPSFNKTYSEDNLSATFNGSSFTSSRRQSVDYCASSNTLSNTLRTCGSSQKQHQQQDEKSSLDTSFNPKLQVSDPSGKTYNFKEEIQNMLSSVRKFIEDKLGFKVFDLKAVQYAFCMPLPTGIEQINKIHSSHFIKARVNKKDFIHVRIYNDSHTQKPIVSLQKNKKEDDAIEYFN